MNIWKEIKIVNSSDRSVKKLVFKQDDSLVEAVLYKYPSYEDRTVICCSVMSGCPVGCRFCGTGDFFVRNLSSDEIVSQVVECIRVAQAEEDFEVSDIGRFQIMFMSMGEPMLNWRNVREAIIALHSTYPAAALLLSTMAPKARREAWSDMIELSRAIKMIGLQFSVHEAIQEKRNALIPMASKLSLEEMSEKGREWYLETGRRPFFNYCVSQNNNSDVEVELLTELFDPSLWECTLSVICERDESIAKANRRQRALVEDFMQKMLLQGHSVRMFDPAGQDDIGGGCGQLFHVQQWIKDNPMHMKKSHGTDLEKVHMPS